VQEYNIAKYADSSDKNFKVRVSLSVKKNSVFLI